MVPFMLTFYNTDRKTVKERSRSRVCINSKEHENVMSFRRHIIGVPRGFGDLGRRAIYFQGTGEHWLIFSGIWGASSYMRGFREPCKKVRNLI